MTEIIRRLYTAFQTSPGVTIDSRAVAPGCIFFGLPGERVDGSLFGWQALDAGAAFSVVRPGTCEPRDGIVFHPDPLRVLQDLARHHRSTLDMPVFAITGSNGKTTTKELIRQVLSEKYQVSSTKGNLNNHIGVPLTLLDIRPDVQIAIVEMGANHVGEIAMLCEIARPTHGMITNIGSAHLEGFGGLEGVKQGKSELYRFLAAEDGVALVNCDEPWLSELSGGISRQVTYRSDTKTGYAADSYTFRYEPGRCAVTFTDRDGNIRTATSVLFGDYNRANIASAIAAGLYFEVPSDNICKAIETYVPRNHRSQTLSIGTNTWIMDAYNANPTSMTAALKSFTQLPAGRKMVVLGAMMELGVHGGQAHLDIASLASGIPRTRVILVGDAFQEAAVATGAEWYADTAALREMLAGDPPDRTTILLKGSRAMRLEALLEAFQ